MRKLLSLIALTLLLAACGQNTPTTPPTAAATVPAAVATAPTGGATAIPTVNTPPAATAYPAPATGATATPAPYPVPSPSAGSVNAPTELVAAVRARLATQLGVDPNKLQLQRAESKQWPDGSLGCPEPGKVYDQYAIPGYLLTFSDGTREYALHTSLATNPGEPLLLCDNQKPIDLSVAAQPTPLAPEAQAMVDLAKQDLVKTLKIDPSTITVLGVTAVEWNDSSLGCPKPGQTYLQVVTPGYLVRLQTASKPYEYHTDSRNQVVQCTP